MPTAILAVQNWCHDCITVRRFTSDLKPIEFRTRGRLCFILRIADYGHRKAASVGPLRALEGSEQRTERFFVKTAATTNHDSRSRGEVSKESR